MIQPIGYWCPLCGDLPTTPNPFPWIPGQAWHHGCCAFVAIPRFKPLDVPEVTTWESPEVVTVTDPDGIHWAAAPCSGYKLTTTGKKILDAWDLRNRAVELWEGYESAAINYVTGAK